MGGGGGRKVVFASGYHQYHIELLMLCAHCVPCTVPGAVCVLSHLILRRRILRDENLPREVVHLRMMELGFASLPTGSLVSVQEEVIQAPQKLQRSPSVSAKPRGSLVLVDFGSFVLQLSVVPQL